jgi:hypothetical protein
MPNVLFQVWVELEVHFKNQRTGKTMTVNGRKLQSGEQRKKLHRVWTVGWGYSIRELGSQQVWWIKERGKAENSND